MYMNFWYPVCSSTELQDQALKVKMLGLPFAAFRDSQQRACVVSDTCAHRGGSLGKGKVVGDCLQCPYHGWEFDGNGNCTRIPAMGDKQPPARAKVDAYPVEEKYGIIFAFLGDLPESDRPPVFEIPEVDQQGWRTGKPMVREMHCYYERSVENGLDPYHNEFVHASQGLPKIIPESTVVTEMPWGTHFIADFGELQEKQSAEKAIASTPGQLCAGSLYHGPNTLVTDIHFNDENAFIQYGFETPVDMNTTRVYVVNVRNCMMEPELDDRVMEINSKVADEDTAILENLWPVRTPDTTTKELLTSGDEMVVRYRRHLKVWEDKGWRLDTKTMARHEGDVAYAIPCPARRESGNWILDQVPLLNA